MASVDGDFLRIALYGAIISMVAFISWTYIDTIDYSFVRYPVSIFVWLGGAYFLCQWLKAAYGYISVELVGRYMIAVCALQCILALSIDRYPPLKVFVNSYFANNCKNFSLAL